MTPEQWHRVKEVFEAALERAPRERSAFLSQACSSDESLHREVESLLSSYKQEKSFMEKPAAAIGALSLVRGEGALVGQQLSRYQIVREMVVSRANGSAIQIYFPIQIARNRR